MRLTSTVPVREWDKWHIALDGGAHPRALKYLGITAHDGTAADPDSPVSIGAIADVMIRFSDSAAPDLLVEILGPELIAEVMDRYDIRGGVPSMLGTYLGILDDSLTSDEQRRQAAQRYASKPNWAVGQRKRISSIAAAADQSNSHLRATSRSLTG